MKHDVESLYGVDPERVRVIANGIDLDQYRPTPDPAVLAKYGVREDIPYILFVGRDHPPEGIIHLVNAIKHLDPGVQVVLCAGAPDTPEIGEEMAAKVEQARRESANPIVWIPQVVPKDEVIALYTQAALFVCPSVYEPFGIINLEAMACETPVVASAVGGIREVVVPERTGLLVPLEAKDRRTSSPSTRSGSRSTSPRPSTDSWPTRSGSSKWAGDLGNGSSITTAGRASPGSRSTFIGI